ncbi:hypothetical protein C1I98_29005 [Spongiactinospora gelatinilytica]|uniref:Uncharacterized protein n=1 Tax=Spongiactinospora gelatinilytica TaxID=2666298 RepID=A0A2W2F7B8_9ACTN|nr:hypothetical protein C1I98_29005 [Spongiactinospora gelatinilytica]
MCLIGVLAPTVACMAAPQRPIVAKRVQPKVHSKELDCGGRQIAGRQADGCVRTTRYVPARYWLITGRGERLEVSPEQYRRCRVGDRYPACVRD